MQSIEECYNAFLQRLRYYHYDTKGITFTWFLVFRKRTQAQKLWWHLLKYKKVTSAEAERIYFFCHPPSIIRDIRKKLKADRSDYRIENITKEGLDCWGNASKYDEYTLNLNFEQKTEEL